MSQFSQEKIFDLLMEMNKTLAVQGEKQDRHGEKLDRIELQANKTNGRVTALEKKHTKIVVQEGGDVKVKGDAIFKPSGTTIGFVCTAIASLSYAIIEVIKKIS